MAVYRETPCMYYIAKGQCSKGRRAEHNSYCQHCAKYRPRVKVRTVNRKKQRLEKIRKEERYR